MSDPQTMIERLQQELTDTRARLGEYSEQVLELSKAEHQKAMLMNEQHNLENQRNRALAKVKAAEDNAAAAERKLKQAGYEILGLQEQLEKVEAERDFLRAEAYELNELNARVESAKSIRDLVS